MWGIVSVLSCDSLTLSPQSWRDPWQSLRSGWCVGRLCRRSSTSTKTKSSTETWKPATSSSRWTVTSSWVRAKWHPAVSNNSPGSRLWLRPSVHGCLKWRGRNLRTEFVLVSHEKSSVQSDIDEPAWKLLFFMASSRFFLFLIFLIQESWMITWLVSWLCAACSNSFSRNTNIC